MNHTTPVTAFKGDKEDFSGTVPGKFFINEAGTYIFYTCPCGCGRPHQLPIGAEKPVARPSWGWDGNRDTPTLAPSIRDLSGCKWHGHLQAGVFIPCNDSGQ